MGIKREIIRIDEEKCNGCGLCVPNCAEGSLVIIDGKAKMVADKYCDGLGACLGHCPQGALSIEVREADEYDHHAVEELLQKPEEERVALAKGEKPAPRPLEPFAAAAPAAPRKGGCPGSGMMTLTPKAQDRNTRLSQTPSSLSHWPIQLRLVPPNAPFLKNADLLLTADCVAASVPDFHARFVPGKVLLMGCPKFDDADMYVERMAAMFRENEINSVTILQMEVPCCSNMTNIALAAIKQAGVQVSVERIIAARTGEIMSSEKLC